MVLFVLFLDECLFLWHSLPLHIKSRIHFQAVLHSSETKLFRISLSSTFDRFWRQLSVSSLPAQCQRKGHSLRNRVGGPQLSSSSSSFVLLRLALGCWLYGVLFTGDLGAALWECFFLCFSEHHRFRLQFQMPFWGSWGDRSFPWAWWDCCLVVTVVWWAGCLLAWVWSWMHFCMGDFSRLPPRWLVSVRTDGCCSIVVCGLESQWDSALVFFFSPDEWIDIFTGAASILHILSV